MRMNRGIGRGGEAREINESDRFIQKPSTTETDIT